MSVRIDQLRAKLKAREGAGGFEKNCEMIRKEIARIERRPEPSPEEIAEAWEAAEKSRSTTSTDNEEASAVASETNKDQSGA